MVQKPGPLCLSLWLVEVSASRGHKAHCSPQAWTSGRTDFMAYAAELVMVGILISCSNQLTVTCQALVISTASSASLGLVLSPVPQDQLRQGSVRWPQQDSPLAFSPHNVLSTLAFSWGPTAHGGERSTNVTLAPCKSRNSWVTTKLCPCQKFPSQWRQLWCSQPCDGCFLHLPYLISGRHVPNKKWPAPSRACL